jgi:hypothetical protein
MDFEKLLKEATELRRQIQQLPQLVDQNGLRMTVDDMDLVVKLQTEIAALSALQDHLAAIVKRGATT